LKRFFFWLLGMMVGSVVLAAPPSAIPPSHGAVHLWLMQLHDVTRQRTYEGTYVVSAGNTMSTSRIWHVCNGREQIERVDALNGERRTTFRRDDSVVTFWPDSRTALRETRESLGLFPNLWQRPGADIGRFYQMQRLGHERVAGIESDVVQLVPADTRRFGYRVWTERQSGLVLKLQTLDINAQVLEQAAFSELKFNAPIGFQQLKGLMENTQGYQVHSPKVVKTTVDQEGWMLGAGVPGFQPVRCYRGVEAGVADVDRSVQCIFSDGLASVSIFVEPFDARRHVQVDAHENLSMGATHLRVRRVQDWWLTAVGEVPGGTLTGLLQALERKK